MPSSQSSSKTLFTINNLPPSPDSLENGLGGAGQPSQDEETLISYQQNPEPPLSKRLFDSFKKIHPTTLALVAFAIATLCGPSEDDCNKLSPYAADVIAPPLQLSLIAVMIVCGHYALKKTQAFEDDRDLYQKIKPIFVMFGTFLFTSHAVSMMMTASSFSAAKSMNLSLSASQEVAVDGLCDDFLEKLIGFLVTAFALRQCVSKNSDDFYNTDLPNMSKMFAGFFIPGLSSGIMGVVTGHPAPVPLVLLPSLLAVFLVEIKANMPLQPQPNDNDQYLRLGGGAAG